MGNRAAWRVVKTVLWDRAAGSPSAEGQLAGCDAVSAAERALWAAQDAVAEALPGALSGAFLRTEADFGATCRVRAAVVHEGTAIPGAGTAFSLAER